MARDARMLNDPAKSSVRRQECEGTARPWLLSRPPQYIHSSGSTSRMRTGRVSKREVAGEGEFAFPVPARRYKKMLVFMTSAEGPSHLRFKLAYGRAARDTAAITTTMRLPGTPTSFPWRRTLRQVGLLRSNEGTGAIIMTAPWPVRFRILCRKEIGFRSSWKTALGYLVLLARRG